MIRKVVFLFLILISFHASAQVSKDKLVQFSGVVLSIDSLTPVPFTSILIRETYRGTISDIYGFYSFVAVEGDTVEFSAIGFKKALYVIPKNLEDSRYSLIQVLHPDTIMLRETIIYPWPTREQFKQAFLAAQIPDDDLERAKKNLAHEALRDAAENVADDGSLAYKYSVQQHSSRLYTAGQYPVNNLLNPIAWLKFIDAWKRGDFKKKE